MKNLQIVLLAMALVPFIGGCSDDENEFIPELVGKTYFTPLFGSEAECLSYDLPGGVKRCYEELFIMSEDQVQITSIEVLTTTAYRAKDDQLVLLFNGLRPELNVTFEILDANTLKRVDDETIWTAR